MKNQSLLPGRGKAAAMGGMLGKRNQFVRGMKMMVKASIHFLDIDVAIKLCCLT